MSTNQPSGREFDDSSREIIKVKQHCLIYLLNEENMTACVFDNDNICGDVFIPRSIKYKTHEFIITSIGESSFENSSGIKQIIFPKDSELRTIEKKAFLYSSITGISLPSRVTKLSIDSFSACQNLTYFEIPSNTELQIIEKDALNSSAIMSLSIPSDISELQEGWINGLESLSKVEIIPRKQKNVAIFNDQLLIGKSDNNNSEFDVIHFIFEQVKEVTIPPFIKIIGSYSFFISQIETIFIPSHITQINEGAFTTRNLRHVIFSPDSELRKIEKFSFAFSRIENIVIPPRVSVIGEESFYMCSYLQSVTFSADSELNTIEANAFYHSGIESLTIPSSVSEFKDGWCSKASKLNEVNIIQNEHQNISYYDDKFIIGKSDIDSDEFDVLLFVRRDVKTVTIPSFIRIIAPYALSGSIVENVIVSSHVRKIGEGAFSYCQKLQSIEFPFDSELQTIGKEVFAYSSIEQFEIPSNVSELEDGWCANAVNLNKVSVMPNNEHFMNLNDTLIVEKSGTEYELLIFAQRNIQTVTIPSFVKIIGSHSFSRSQITNIKIPHHITKICESAFAGCAKLTNVEIPMNSQLESIGKYAFAYTKISNIFIPDHITQICECSFKYASDLEYVDFSSNSELQVINAEAFNYTSIKCLMIPRHTTKICRSAFKSYDQNISIIEIDQNSDIKTFDKINNYDLQDGFIMIPTKLKNCIL